MKKAAVYFFKLLICAAILGGFAYAGFWIFLYMAFSDLPDTLVLILFGAMVIGMFYSYIKIAKAISRGGDEDGKARKSFFKIIIPSVLIVFLIGTYDTWSDDIKKENLRRRFSAADEVLCYDRGAIGDTFGIHLEGNSAAINYSDMKVALIYGNLTMYTDVIKLKKCPSGTEIGDNIQYVADLEGGRKFYAFYKVYEERPGEYGNTEGIGIEMEDGSFWYGESDHSYIGFDTVSPRIKKAMATADIIIPYGSDKMPVQAMGLERNTILIDTDSMTGAVVCLSIRDGETVMVFDDITFRPAESDDVPIKQNSFFADGYEIYGYCVRQHLDWEQDRSDGIMLITPDGQLYESKDWGYYNFLNVNAA